MPHVDPDTIPDTRDAPFFGPGGERRTQGERRQGSQKSRFGAGQRRRDEARTSGRVPGGVRDPRGRPESFRNIVIYTDWNTGFEYTMANIEGFIRLSRQEGYQGVGTGPLDERFFRSGGDRMDRWLKFVKDMQAFQVARSGGLPDAFGIQIRRPPTDPGGGGFAGPKYQAPDRDAVEEFLKPFQVAVTGSLQEDILEAAIDQYLTTDRQDFDDKNARHDPGVAAKNVIRNSSAYKDVQELRPDSEDELQWVTKQQTRLRMVGLGSAEAQNLGIQLARVGAGEEAAKEAGEGAFFSGTGRVARSQRASLKRSASAVMGLL